MMWPDRGYVTQVFDKLRAEAERGCSLSGKPIQRSIMVSAAGRRWEEIHRDADRDMLLGQGRGASPAGVEESPRSFLPTFYADAAIPCCAATPRIPAALRAAAAGRNTIAPKRPDPALTACTDATLIFPAASFASSWAAAPGRSSPCTKNAVCFLPSLSLDCFAAATSAAVFSGTKMSSAFVAVR